jgi:hypothetical protein
MDASLAAAASTALLARLDAEADGSEGGAHDPCGAGAAGRRTGSSLFARLPAQLVLLWERERAAE